MTKFYAIATDTVIMAIGTSEAECWMDYAQAVMPVDGITLENAEQKAREFCENEGWDVIKPEECTEALYELAAEEGGDISWDRNEDGALCTVDEA